MKEAIYSRLEQIHSQVNTLVKTNKELNIKILALEDQIIAAKKIIDIQKNTIEKLELQNNLTNIANEVNLLDKEEKKRIKASISEQIKEIDNCLKLLKMTS